MRSPSLLAPLVAATVALCPLPAQQLMLPDGSYYEHTGSSGLTWRATEFRFQAVYDTTHFTAQGVTGPIAIQRLSFRAADGVVNLGGAVYPVVNVRLSSCPRDYASLSLTFADNRGANAVLVWSQPVTIGAAGGGAPNNQVIDLPLSTPFVYDPTLGADLAIEVDATAPSLPARVPLFATTSGAAGERAGRVAAASVSALTGAASAFAPDVLIQFTGGGGYPSWTRARSIDTGAGCYITARSFYEYFPSLIQFDLGGVTMRMTPNAVGGYDVQSGPLTTIRPHGPTGLGMGDESVVVQTLPSAFGAGLPIPGGTTTAISICANGYLWLGSSTVSDYSPSAVELLQGPLPRIAPLWADLLPDAAHDVYYDVDPAGTKVWITWDYVPTFEVGGYCAMQVGIDQNGVVECSYYGLAGVPTTDVVCGFSPGNGALDPGPRDLSTATSFTTAAPESLGLTLRSNLPRIGRDQIHTLANIPPSAVLSARLIGVVPQPGFDLASLGAPGCALWIDNNAAEPTLLFGGPVVTTTIPVPDAASLLGVVMIAQAVSLVPGANLLGIETSNQNLLVIGNS